jgi:hypothetical protein
VIEKGSLPVQMVSAVSTMETKLKAFLDIKLEFACP